MRKKKFRYLAQFTIDAKNEKKNPSIMRVILAEEYIQVDMGYAAPDIYINGGWIDISPNTFISVQGSEKQYSLIEARNITLAPQKINFESKADWCVFSLFFKPIPIEACTIDIIESLTPTKNDFNYYSIQLNSVSSIQLLSNIEHL